MKINSPQNLNGCKLYKTAPALKVQLNCHPVRIVVDSCKLVVDGMYIFREAFRLLAVLFNQLSKSGDIYRGE